MLVRSSEKICFFLLGWKNIITLYFVSNHVFLRTLLVKVFSDSMVRCTMVEESSAPFSLGGDNLKRYILSNNNASRALMNHGYLFTKKRRVLSLIEIPFHIGSPSNENGAELFPIIVQSKITIHH